MSADMVRALTWEMHQAFKTLGAKSDLLGTVASIRDTIDDQTALECLKEWNRRSKLHTHESSSGRQGCSPHADPQTSHPEPSGSASPSEDTAATRGPGETL
jgi:hypothetical protein